MLQEGKGPINFTVFLTLFGEKLNGEPGTGLDPPGWAANLSPTWTHQSPTQPLSGPHPSLGLPEGVGLTFPSRGHWSPHVPDRCWETCRPSASAPKPRTHSPAPPDRGRGPAEPCGVLCSGKPFPASSWV